jgi:hypothetical protein
MLINVLISNVGVGTWNAPVCIPPKSTQTHNDTHCVVLLFEGTEIRMELVFLVISPTLAIEPA